MAKKILVVNGSPKKGGNTDTLVGWFAEGARSHGAEVEVVRAAELKLKAHGCLSCRACQKSEQYGCVVDDGLKPVLGKMIEADAIVMATPLYFFSASAQLKSVFDRMFSLYKWDNAANSFETPLKGKTFAVIASAYEDIGMNVLERPFRLTADYTGMGFKSLLVTDAGVSGDLSGKDDIKEKATRFGSELA